MDKIDAVPKYIEMFRSINWRWDKTGMEALVFALGLELQRTTGSWMHFRFSGEDLTCSVLFRGEKIERVEAYIDVNEQLGQLLVHNPSRYYDVRDKVYQEFDTKFEHAVALAAAILGPPQFQGSWEDASCPDPDAYPLRIAAWTILQGQIMIEYQNQDKELPLEICIVVMPPGERK